VSSEIERKAQRLRNILAELNREQNELKELRDRAEQKREKCRHLQEAYGKASDDLYKEAVGPDLAKHSILMFG
jgi:chromosome segregation ATPase